MNGGGIPVGRLQQLFLLVLGQGKKQPADWANFVWQILSVQDQLLLNDGKALDSAEANLAELTVQASEFAEKHLAILKALQVA